LVEIDYPRKEWRGVDEKSESAQRAIVKLRLTWDVENEVKREEK
jgi:hypothetical protein